MSNQVKEYFTTGLGEEYERWEQMSTAEKILNIGDVSLIGQSPVTNAIMNDNMIMAQYGERGLYVLLEDEKLLNLAKYVVALMISAESDINYLNEALFILALHMKTSVTMEGESYYVFGFHLYKGEVNDVIRTQQNLKTVSDGLIKKIEGYQIQHDNAKYALCRQALERTNQYGSKEKATLPSKRELPDDVIRESWDTAIQILNLRVEKGKMSKRQRNLVSLIGAMAMSSMQTGWKDSVSIQNAIVQKVRLTVVTHFDMDNYIPQGLVPTSRFLKTCETKLSANPVYCKKLLVAAVIAKYLAEDSQNVSRHNSKKFLGAILVGGYLLRAACVGMGVLKNLIEISSRAKIPLMSLLMTFPWQSTYSDLEAIVRPLKICTTKFDIYNTLQKHLPSCVSMNNLSMIESKELKFTIQVPELFLASRVIDDSKMGQFRPEDHPVLYATTAQIVSMLTPRSDILMGVGYLNLSAELRAQTAVMAMGWVDTFYTNISTEVVEDLPKHQKHSTLTKTVKELTDLAKSEDPKYLARLKKLTNPSYNKNKKEIMVENIQVEDSESEEEEDTIKNFIQPEKTKFPKSVVIQESPVESTATIQQPKQQTTAPNSNTKISSSIPAVQSQEQEGDDKDFLDF